VGRLDLSKESREVTLIPSPTKTIFEYTDDIEISVAQHDDLFIGALNNSRSTPKQKLYIFKNGEQLPYTMAWTDFAPDNPSSYYLDYQFRFAEDGKLYTVLDNAFDTVIRKFSINDSTAVQDFSITVRDGDRSYYPINIMNNQLLYLDSTIVDLDNGSVGKKIKKPDINISMYALLPSIDSGRIYELGQHYSIQGSTLYVFDSTSGEFLKSFNLRRYEDSGSRVNTKLIELPNEILVKEEDGTLFKVPKYHLQ
jgi:hypothetical protein